MKENEENERKWKKMKENERKRKGMTENDRKCQKVKRKIWMKKEEKRK